MAQEGDDGLTQRLARSSSGERGMDFKPADESGKQVARVKKRRREGSWAFRREGWRRAQRHPAQDLAPSRLSLALW